MDTRGLLLCARYSSAPNFFGYCGPEENVSLVDHLKERTADKEVEIILSQFDTLYSYLKLISVENKIGDPFNHEVVEAYWIGNSLLNHISNRNYAYLLQEELDLENKMGKIKFQRVKAKALSTKFYPHHAFHVFNIFKRTGQVNSNHTIDTMDSCRIGWGTVKEIRKLIQVKTRQLSISNKQLSLSSPTVKELQIDYKGKQFIQNLNIGDWVSFHWGFVCDKLTPPQLKNLEFYTQQAINYFNCP